MHMADALISPAVGISLWLTSGVAVARAVKLLKQEDDQRRIPLMGVTGAFLFAAQMINMAIPGTGSSGHLAGGVLLSALIGPSAALLVMASVLAIQALMFADGGLLAFGCNLFNLGVIPALIVYPFIYRPIMAIPSITYPRRLLLATVPSALVALQLGALAVVIETTLSGVVGIPLKPFLLLMQPMHLAIGIVEAILTGSVLMALYRMNPELFQGAESSDSDSGFRPYLRMTGSLLILSILVAGIFSWAASDHPDGLEWSLSKLQKQYQAIPVNSTLHTISVTVQSVTAAFPDYGFGKGDAGGNMNPVTEQRRRTQTSVSGLIGLTATLVCAVCAGFIARYRLSARLR